MIQTHYRTSLQSLIAIPLVFGFLFFALPTTLLAKMPAALVTKIYALSYNPFELPDISNPNGIPLPGKGVKLLPNNGINAISYDVSTFFRLQGVPLSEGSEAVFFLVNNVLVVRASVENIDLVETLMTIDDAQSVITHVSSEFVVGTFSLPANEEIHLPMQYIQFHKQAANNWKIVNQLSVFSKSGVKATSISRQMAKEDEPPNKDSSNQPFSEIKAEVEMVAEPDGNTLDNTFNFSFRGPVLKDSVINEISLNSIKTSWNEYPSVIYLTKIGPVATGSKTDRDNYLAVILKMSISNSGGWKINTR